MTPAEFKAARLKLGMTQQQLATALQIGKRTVERMDNEGCTYAMALAVECLIRRAS